MKKNKKGEHSYVFVMNKWSIIFLIIKIIFYI